VPLVPPLLAMVIWRSGHVEKAAEDWFDWGQKAKYIVMALRDQSMVFDLASLAVLLVLLGVAIAVVMFAVLGAAVAAFVASFSDAQQMQTFFTQPTDDVMRELTPWGLAAAALSAIVSTFGLVIFTAPWAEAYRQITGDRAATEEVFG
jgi:hypothetical protein